MRAVASALAVAGLLLIGAGPVAAQDEGEIETDEPVEGAVEHADIEGGGHGEHPGHKPDGHHGAQPPHPVNWYQWHVGKDLHGGELHDDEQPMPPGLLFALLNFAVFLGLLIKLAGPKLGSYLRTRHETVRDQLAEAARLRAEARAKLDEYNQRIAAVDAEVGKLMAEIRAESEAEREMILTQARNQAEALKKEAERRIESEIARARLSLEREVASAAVAAAEAILRERTTGDDQARMFGGFVDTLLQGPPGAQVEQPSKVDEEWT